MQEMLQDNKLVQDKIKEGLAVLACLLPCSDASSSEGEQSDSEGNLMSEEAQMKATSNPVLAGPGHNVHAQDYPAAFDVRTLAWLELGRLQHQTASCHFVRFRIEWRIEVRMQLQSMACLSSEHALNVKRSTVQSAVMNR